MTVIGFMINIFGITILISTEKVVMMGHFLASLPNEHKHTNQKFAAYAIALGNISSPS